MPLPALAYAGIMAALGAASSYYTSSQQRRFADSQYAWDQYNSMMQFNTNVGNIKSQFDITMFNVGLSLIAGRSAGSAAASAASRTAEVSKVTAVYNNHLLDLEADLIWEDADLEVEQRRRQAEIERGAIRARQGASGTVVGEDTNAGIIVDQMLQEEMDTFIIRHGADIQMAKIENQKAQNTWQGEVAAIQAIHEGSLASWSATNNAKLSAASTLVGGVLSANASSKSNMSQWFANQFGAQFNLQTGQGNAANNLVNGLFSAAGTGVSTYAAFRTPTVKPESEGAGTSLLK